MGSNRAVLGCFMGVIALITYRDFRHPDATWPLGPVPPPYRFTYAAVVFGLITILSNVWSPRIATIIASGVLIGTLYAVISGKSATAGLQANAPGYSGTTAQARPATNGTTGSTSLGGGTIQA